MAKRRTYKRDRLGRFAGGVTSIRIRHHQRSARQITRGIRIAVASERSYIKDTGDVGTKRDVARFNAKIARATSKAAGHRARVRALRARSRR